MTDFGAEEEQTERLIMPAMEWLSDEEAKAYADMINECGHTGNKIAVKAAEEPDTEKRTA